MVNKFIQWTLNLSAGIFFFLLFLFLFFPMEELARHYISQVEVQTKGQYRIFVSEIEPSLIFKSSVKKLEVYQRDNDGNENLIVSLPEAKVGLSYLPLMAGVVKASFVANAGKGRISGVVSLSEKAQDLNVTIKDFNLDNFPYLATALKVPLKGSISGKIDIDYNSAEFLKSDASVDLQLIQFMIPQTNLMPVSGFELELPDTVLTDATGGKIKLALKNGKLEFKEFNLPGPDMSLELSGNVQLNKKTQFSRLNLNGSFSFSDKIKEALPFVVVIETQKTEQGRYPLSISGRLNKPQIQVGTFDLTSLTGGFPAM